MEALLLERVGERRFSALVRPARRLRSGSVVRFGTVKGTVLTDPVDGKVELEIGGSGDVEEAIETIGDVPLPPYIKRPIDDPARYQTIYADRPGSSAAPTAGLHVTEEVLGGLTAREIGVAAVDLEVGLDTFRPIATDYVGEHTIHRERYSVSEDTAARIEATREGGGRVVALGTTVVRVLETNGVPGSRVVEPGEGTTGLVHRARVLFQRDRSVGDQLPHVAQHADRPGCRLHGSGVAHRLHQRRWEGDTAFSPSAMRCWRRGGLMSEARGDRTRTVGRGGTRRSGPDGSAPHAARDGVDPRLHAGGNEGLGSGGWSRRSRAVGTDIVLANAFHLMLRPGDELVAGLGGLHGFMGWEGPILTDSGGFQVFSLGPKIDETGARFRSPYDGSWLHLTPERAVEVQERLGSDIAMVLDVCLALPAPGSDVRAAMERTLRWSERGLAAHRRPDQALFGIVQGGTDQALRATSARATAALDVPGFGIGGLSVGETPEERRLALEVTVAELPPGKVRYVMGLGDPVGVLDAVALGADLFDCVWPTRLARHGKILTADGDYHIKAARFAADPSPLHSECGCSTCHLHSRAYLRHLHVTGELLAHNLLTVHNLHYTLQLIAATRLSYRRTPV